MDHKTILTAVAHYKEIATALGLHPTTVSRWKENGIPPEYWPVILRMAQAKGASWITLDLIEVCSPIYGDRVIKRSAQPVS